MELGGSLPDRDWVHPTILRHTGSRLAGMGQHSIEILMGR